MRVIRYICLILIYLHCHYSIVKANNNDTTNISFPEKVIGLAETVLNAVTIEKEKWSMALYPAASYSSRQGLAVGIMPMLQIRSEKNNQPSTIAPTILVSTNKMFEIQCDADIFLRNGQNILVKAEFYYLPDKYYGIGNEKKDSALAEYDIYRYLLTSEYTKQIGNKGFKLGIFTDFTYHKFKNIDTNQDIIPFILESSKWSNGIGLIVAFDNRDNVVYPRNGWYIRSIATTYRELLGSNLQFNTLSIDARHYWPIGKESVFAVQTYFATASANTPFHKMPTIGGTRLGRAIPHCYKYVDSNAWLVQSEIRLPIYWRIGFTTFVGAGNVCHKLSNDFFDKTHLMAGAGLRFKVFPKQGLNLRLDAGLSSRGDKAIYFNIREAF